MEVHLTEEEVNDVKTFGKLLLTLPAFAFGCVTYFGIIMVTSSIAETGCMKNYPVVVTFYSVIAIGIPLCIDSTSITHTNVTVSQSSSNQYITVSERLNYILSVLRVTPTFC